MLYMRVDVSVLRQVNLSEQINNNSVIYYKYFISFRADIALIGLAVMGQNLILNMNDHGFTVSISCQIPFRSHVY